MNALIGKKLGMTQVFDENGVQVPVTVIQGGPCVVVQRKKVQTDGYDAVQLGFGDQKVQRLTQPQAGHYKKHNVKPCRILREVRVDATSESKEGDEVTVSLFEGVGYVDICGISKGRGFQGVIRRHGFGRGRMTHGSHSKRRPGSIGMCEWPGRVFKGKKMPGQMGSARVTTQNLRIVAVRPEEHVILVRGAVPGPTGGIVMVSKALKKVTKAS
jgi:large subunit ribosomal protein L3